MDGLEAWRVEFVALELKYDALIQTGTLTGDEALRQHLHEVLERIAPELRLRYDRLERR